MEYLLLLIFMGIIFVSLKQIYHRYFNDFRKEISEVLRNKNIELISLKSPKSEDWVKGPFDKDPMIRVSVVTVNNEVLTSTKYKIIEVKTPNNKDIEMWWVQISMTYFMSPEFKFLKEDS